MNRERIIQTGKEAIKNQERKLEAIKDDHIMSEDAFLQSYEEENEYENY